MGVPIRVVALAVLALCAWSGQARAYSSPEAFYEPAASGGGGGRWFTGSPADGYGCSSCHTRAKEQREYPLYVTGLADDGFAPGSAREIVLSWPEFADYRAALRGDPMQPMAADAPLPVAGLVAELVAESGKGSGTLEIRTQTAEPGELCEMTRPNLVPRVAGGLYQVRPGVYPIAIEPDANGVMRCEARQLGQRCIVALDSCGARQLRLVWIAPPQSEGPVWFSAGFVASEAISGTPELDSVVEVTFPMSETGTPSGAYTEHIHGTCSVAQPGRPSGAGALWIVAALMLGVRRFRRGALRLLLCFAFGCASAEDTGRPEPLAGLYAPGSALGASDPTDVPRPGMGVGERCVTPTTALQGDDSDAGLESGEGELQVEYETATLDGRYAPKNCAATWIETEDGQFVATIEITAALRKGGLVYFQQRTCTQEPGPDVVTSATLKDHTKVHSASWSGRDYQGNSMPDGPYILAIEVTETDKAPGELETFEFEKGPAFSGELPVAGDGFLQRVSIAWITEDGSGP